MIAVKDFESAADIGHPVPNKSRSVESAPAALCCRHKLRLTVRHCLRVIGLSRFEAILRRQGQLCPFRQYAVKALRSGAKPAASRPTGLPVKGVILPHQLRTIDFKATRARLKTLLGL
jgi:hypothetical protein